MDLTQYILEQFDGVLTFKKIIQQLVLLDFENRLMEILSINYNQYLSQTINPKLIYNLDFKTLEFLRGEMQK